MVQLLIALALFIFFAPFVEEIRGGDLIVSILLSLVLISALKVSVSGCVLQSTCLATKAIYLSFGLLFASKIPTCRHTVLKRSESSGESLAARAAL